MADGSNIYTNLTVLGVGLANFFAFLKWNNGKIWDEVAELRKEVKALSDKVSEQRGELNAAQNQLREAKEAARLQAEDAARKRHDLRNKYNNIVLKLEWFVSTATQAFHAAHLDVPEQIMHAFEEASRLKAEVDEPKASPPSPPA